MPILITSISATKFRISIKMITGMRPKKSIDLKSLPMYIGIHNRMVNDPQ